VQHVAPKPTPKPTPTPKPKPKPTPTPTPSATARPHVLAYAGPPAGPPHEGASLVTLTLLITAPAILAVAALRPQGRRRAH
jgi:outer membrane biosynthesis protein TonB